MDKIIATKIINPGSVIKLAIATLFSLIVAIGFSSGISPAFAQLSINTSNTSIDSEVGRSAYIAHITNITSITIPDRLHRVEQVKQLAVINPLADLNLFEFSDPDTAVDDREKIGGNFYEKHAVHSPDGIGKFYLGREIAKVMGHTEAVWLERPGREWQEEPDQVIAALDLQPDDIVADIGAGTGYFSFRLSSQLPQGKVLAIDIQPEMIDILQFLKQENNIDNVETVLGDPQNPHLAAQSIDLALMVDAYHEFAYPREMMQGVVNALKPGGRVVLVEYRRENPFIAIKTLHKMTQKQAIKEMAAVGLDWQETNESLPSQHMMIFQKPKLPGSIAPNPQQLDYQPPRIDPAP
jgi:precorrin-6B methylase 2